MSGNTPTIYPDAESRQAAYRKATDHLLFTKDFNTALEAWRDDPLETLAPRVLAWAKRSSWGRWSLYCVTEDGNPAFQVHCAKDLGVDKRRVSDTVDYLVKRGFLAKDGKVLYPVISPVPVDNPFKSDRKSGEFGLFIEHWKVAHSADFQELEVARSTVKRIQKVLLSEYKKWRTPETNGRPSLLLEEEEFKEEPPTPSQPFLSAELEEEPAGRLEVEVPEYIPEPIEPRTIPIPIKEEVRAYLESIPKPGLTPQIVEEVQKHISTPEALEAFKVETLPAKVQGAQTWKYFVAIAQRVSADAPRYAAAKANGGNGPSPPKTGFEAKLDAYVRRREEEETKARGR